MNNLNITIWGSNREKAIERLFIAYGSNYVIIDESPIFNKSDVLIGFRFVLEATK